MNIHYHLKSGEVFHARDVGLSRAEATEGLARVAGSSGVIRVQLPDGEVIIPMLSISRIEIED